ncbi:hypothetical protein [Pseudomonas laurentiana]|uniref:hypothetical protein n=1 Tax=Pseudomonas laurentiana TaxID=2364649 RepID=UPI0016732BBD|nr:hypothetical protein [Pseudomonas laurentiana]
MKVLEGLSSVKSLLSHWVRPRELPPQLTWKYAHESELLGWRIKARNYNTVIANGLFVFWLVVAVWFGFSVYSNFERYDEPMRSLCALLFFSVLMVAVLSMTHQRMNFAYRFTASGAEFCEWKNFPEWALRFLTCLAIISAIIFACMASLYRDASFLIYAVIAPAKMMLLRASMNSKNYRGVHTIFHLRTFEWSEFTEVEVDRKQKLVGLKFAWYDNYLNISKISTAPLYARRREFDTILAFLEKQVPELTRSLQSVERA